MMAPPCVDPMATAIGAVNGQTLPSRGRVQIFQDKIRSVFERNLTNISARCTLLNGNGTSLEIIMVRGSHTVARAGSRARESFSLVKHLLYGRGALTQVFEHTGEAEE